MDRIIIADKTQHAAWIPDLFLEYLQWGVSRINQEYGLEFSAEDTIEQDMVSLDKYMPPKGRLLLATADGSPVGTACLKELTKPTGEIKRMYVKPEFRSRGIGRALAQKLIDEAIEAGYTCLRLDSARFMTDAHRLYRSIGFSEIEPYEGSEIPPEFSSIWVYMEQDLI
jgi:GNAT superfamily N-acetyltransferase